MGRSKFFDFSLNQTVNQWLGISLISLLCFWVVLFYFTQKTEQIGKSFTAAAGQY